MADIILGILMLAAILGFAIWVGAAIGGGIESGLLSTYDLKKNPYDHRLGGEAWGGNYRSIIGYWSPLHVFKTTLIIYLRIVRVLLKL